MTHKGDGGFVTTSYPTPFDPTDCSPPGSSVHGISQGRILVWVAIFFFFFWPFSSPGDLSDPGSDPVSPALADRFFTIEPPGKLPELQ